MTLTDLYLFADQHEISVTPYDLGGREALSLQGADGKCHIAIDPLKLKSTADEMAKLGHELGHCETGAFYNQYSRFDVRNKYENRANKWMIEHMIPENELNNQIEQGQGEIWELAEYFQVTEEYIKKAVCWYRYGNLAVEQYFL